MFTALPVRNIYMNQHSQKIMSIDVAYALAMMDFPSLYTGKSKEESLLKFYDQVFNVIGNGYGDQESFENKFKVRHGLTVQPVNPKYHDSGNLFCISDKNFNVIGNCLTIEEIVGKITKMDGVDVYSVSPVNDRDFTPYPNFQKRYSLLFVEGVADLFDSTWLDAMDFYYRKCLEFFASERIREYHYHHPADSDTKQWGRLIKDYEKSFERYYKDYKNDTEAAHKAISKEYELMFDGDIKGFIKRRSEKRVSEAVSFIHDALNEIATLKRKINNSN